MSAITDFSSISQFLMSQSKALPEYTQYHLDTAYEEAIEILYCIALIIAHPGDKIYQCVAQPRGEKQNTSGHLKILIYNLKKSTYTCFLL